MIDKALYWKAIMMSMAMIRLIMLVYFALGSFCVCMAVRAGLYDLVICSSIVVLLCLWGQKMDREPVLEFFRFYFIIVNLFHLFMICVLCAFHGMSFLDKVGVVVVAQLGWNCLLVVGSTLVQGLLW